MSEKVHTHIEDRVCFVTITAPERKNALSRNILLELRDTFVDLESHDAAAVVLSGAGETFSAGADFRELTGTSDDLSFDALVDEMVAALRAIPIPVLAAIEGPCLGAAVELALACDFRVAGADAWLQLPAVQLGILYNPRSVARMHRILPNDTLTRLLLLGERFPAPSAHGAGLVGDVVESGWSRARAADFAAGFDRVPKDALAATKGLLSELDDGVCDVQRWQGDRSALLASADRRQAVAGAHRRHS